MSTQNHNKMCRYCIYFLPKKVYLSSDYDRCIKPVGPILKTTPGSVCVNFREGGVR